MGRYEPVVTDGILFLQLDGDRIEIGDLDDIVDAVGGEEYTISYSDEQRTVDWLVGTDEGDLTIDVRDTITTMDHHPDTVAALRRHDMSVEKHGIPERAVSFADFLVDAWEEQGE